MGDGKPAKPRAKKGTAKRRQSAAELAPRILEMLPGKQAHIAQALDRKPSDGTVRKALDGLKESGAAERVDGVWRRCEELRDLAIPEDFDQDAIGLLTRTHAALVEQGTWRDHDQDLLVRYVRRDQDARKFRRARGQYGDFQQATTRVYANPAIDKERDALRDVQQLADALVITPDARRRHGRDGDEAEGGDEFDL
jgi:phage terminase small subunit